MQPRCWLGMGPARMIASGGLGVGPAHSTTSVRYGALRVPNWRLHFVCTFQTVSSCWHTARTHTHTRTHACTPDWLNWLALVHELGTCAHTRMHACTNTSLLAFGPGSHAPAGPEALHFGPGSHAPTGPEVLHFGSGSRAPTGPEALHFGASQVFHP